MPLENLTPNTAEWRCPSTEKAAGIIYGTIVKQATLAAFIDNFRLLGIMCLLCIAAVFLLKKVKAHGPVAVH